MAGRQRNVGDVIEQRSLGESFGQGERRVLPVVDDDQVDVAPHEFRNGFARFLFMKGDRELRVLLAQGGDGLRREAARRGGKGGNGDRPAHRGVLRFELGFRFFEQRQHALRPRNERVGGVGELHAAAVPLEQRLPGFAFELGQLLRHRGGGDVQGFGGGDDRAVGRHGVQGAQAIQVQHASNSKLNRQELFTCSKHCQGDRGAA